MTVVTGIASMLTACGSNAAREDSATSWESVSGTATYRERIALPPSAVFEASLEDISRADAPAETLGTTRLESPGQVPIPFSISYDPARIDSRHRYAVRARITVEGELMFTSDTVHPVITQGSGSTFEIVMRRVGESVPAGAATSATADTPSTTPLVNTYWKVVRLGTRPVVVAERQREPHIVLHTENDRVAGSSGCNSLAGSYTTSADLLSFGRVAGTLMACPEGMEQERMFLDALTKVFSYRIEGEQLELFDAAGTSIITLQSVYLR